MPTGDTLAGIPIADGTAITASAGDSARAGATASTSGGAFGDATLAHTIVAAALGRPSAGVGGITAPAKGVYIGDGLPPVPAKIAAKIRRGEYIEMGEMLPEFWALPKDEDPDGKREGKGRRTRKVTDIQTWIQCFGAYVSVLGPGDPSLIPELMAYMAMIVRASQDYDGLAWVRYDAGFRRQAAMTGNKRWSAINSTLYTVCFTGAAKPTKRCELCCATTHTEKECAQQGDPDPGMRDRLKTLETAILAMARPPATQPPRQGGGPRRTSGEVCRLWNRNTCSYPVCRHIHVCSTCGGDHQAIRCSAAQPPQRQQVAPTARGAPPAVGKHFNGPARPY